MRSNLEKIVLLLVLVGMLLSGYALTLHYKDGGSVCDINERFSCDTVNKSPWADVYGVPVALLGLLASTILFLAVLKRKALADLLGFTDRDVWQYVLFFVAAMTAFQVYLTTVEVVYIGAYCIICLANQAVVLALLALVFLLWKEA